MSSDTAWLEARVAGTGPPPKDPSVRARRNKTVARLRLPAGGRGADAEPPAWPLGPDRGLERLRVAAEVELERLRGQAAETSDRRKGQRLERGIDSAVAARDVVVEQLAEQARLESHLWTELWRTPQAVAWAELGWSREVALYVRCTLKAEDGDMRAAGEARQRSDRLGLSPLALLRLGWEIDQAPVEEAAPAEEAPASAKMARKRAAKRSADDPRRALHAV